jgi:hypothetical protein
MKENKSRVSKLSIVAFVIVCLFTTQHSQAQTFEASSDTGFISIIWSYFFSTPNTNNSGVTGEDPTPTPDPDEPGGGKPPTAPTPCPYPSTNPRVRCGSGPGNN